MGKKFKLYFIIGAAVVVFLIILLFFLAGRSPTVKASLLVDQGTVEVNGKTVSTSMTLREGDTIETFSTSATVILYESLVIDLEPNTKITLAELTKDHPLVQQESGTTWNKFTGLLGMEDYSIESGNTVASVRGTNFQFSEDKVFTEEGDVDVNMDQQNHDLPAGMVVERVNQKITKRAATAAELAAAEQRKQRIVKALQNLRELEIKKHPVLYKTVKSTYGYTDADIQQLLSEADQGRYDIDKTLESSPWQTPSIKKVAGITKEIRKLQDTQQTRPKLNESQI